MRVAVTSTVVFDVPDEGRTLGEIRDRFYEAHQAIVGEPMETLTGQRWILRAIERLEIEGRARSAAANTPST